MRRVGAVILMLASLSGCASQTHGRDFRTDGLRSIKPGTPSDEVVRMLGEPTMRNITAPGAEQWTYSFAEAVGRVSPMAFIPIANMFAGGTAEGRFKTVSVSFEGNLVTRRQFTTQITKQGGTTAFDMRDQGSSGYSAPCDAIDTAGVPK